MLILQGVQFSFKVHPFGGSMYFAVHVSIAFESPLQISLLKFAAWFASREGVIIECPLNDLFHDVVTVIITSQMAVI